MATTQYQNNISRDNSNQYPLHEARSDSAKEAGEYGERLLQQELRDLKGRIIHGYITSTNMVIDGQNFELDFLILVPKAGLVVAEVKFYEGTVYCTRDESWKQVKSNGEELRYHNACLQVLRTERLLRRLLQEYVLDNWPITPLVIFVHPKARILRAKGNHNPQTDIITLPMLEGWITNLPRDEYSQFNQEDFEELYLIIKAHERDYNSTEPKIHDIHRIVPPTT